MTGCDVMYNGQQWAVGAVQVPGTPLTQSQCTERAVSLTYVLSPVTSDEGLASGTLTPGDLLTMAPLCWVLVLAAPLLVSAQDPGSGHQYLQRTEDTNWDGKTAWFTGSSRRTTY